MKYLFLILFFNVFFSFSINAQVLHGVYRNKDEYLNFEGDSVVYYLKLGCCIVNEYKGLGKWFLANNKLLIKPINNEQTYISTSPSLNNDSLYINVEIKDTASFLLPSIRIYNTNDRYFGIGTNGRHVAISKKSIRGGDSLSVSLYGYLSANCKLNISLDYSIKLSKGSDSSYIEPILKLSKNGLPVKIKGNKIIIKRLINIDHKENQKWVIYLKQ
jgi:hypothetical protein